ncbi:MAG TPA: hypothetical protein VG456_15845 [Candidatus Sulfopaludibacter sp.]|jgi:tetratricopeptide (TPR) repeat protein|nr:hypothetical protein [Candidatus Sulfopaludibacter sp.]
MVIFIIARPKNVHQLEGYIGDTRSLQTEFERMQGTPFKSKELRKQFEDAAAAVENGQYDRAAVLLETASKRTPMPILYNDLGILYEQRKDSMGAIKAYTQALGLDPGYVPAHYNLLRLNPDTEGPASSEGEPNNTAELANNITLNQPLEGEIKDAADQDYFKLLIPPGPRDQLEVTLQNRSKTLQSALRFFDDKGAPLSVVSTKHEPGESFSQTIAPPPGTLLYVRISSEKSTTGEYSLIVKTLKNFDHWEPNDDIFSAKSITVGDRIDANIMDENDSDFYSFVSPRNGTVTIEIQTEASDFLPALTTFTPDKRKIGISPDVDRHGKVSHTFPVEAGLTYYIQVSGQQKTAGKYSLIIQ